jgi:hypothetical protein
MGGFQTLDKVVDEFDRVTILVYGPPRCGKTTMAVKVAESGDIVFVMAYDRGVRAAVERRDKIGKKMRVAFPEGLLETRKLIVWLKKTIDGLVAKGHKASKIWTFVDTVTHAQSLFLTQSRSVQINVAGTVPKVGKEIVRDAITQADFNILHAWMNELVNGVLAIKGNVVFFALEKYDKKIKRTLPSLYGQNAGKVCGDVDVIARMEVAEKGDKTAKDGRILWVAPNSEWEAGIRGAGQNAIGETCGPDLLGIRNKILDP